MRTLKNQHIRYILSVLVSSWGTRIYFFLCLFFFLQLPLIGQEEHTPEQEQIDLVQEQTGGTESPKETSSTKIYTGKTIFYIRNINFDITGSTRPFALLYYGELREGERIEGEDPLTGYINDKTQLLLNQRVLEKAEIDYTLGEVGEDGLVPVDLLVKVVDTMNIIALPYLKFDSNSGFELILKVRDYNFLGTMSPLRFDLGYQRKEIQDEPSKDIFKSEIDSDTPFRLLGLNWNLDFDHIFSAALQDGDPIFYYKNITGLSVEVPYNRTAFTFGFEENSIVNEENPAQYKKEYGEYDDFYMTSKLYASWKIPLGLEVYEFGELSYTPEMSGTFNYRPEGELEFWRKGPTLTFGQRLGAGRINWTGNYRNGFEGVIKNSNTYDFYNKGWDFNYSISVVTHRIVSDFWGISGQYQFRHWFFKDADGYTETGGALRGILDKSLIAKNNNCILSLNLDFPLRVLRFVPSEWLETRKLRFFDFDLHVSPFIDIALFWGLNGVEWKDGLITTPQNPSVDVPAAMGFEFIVFPAFMRSLYLRVSIGYNLQDWWHKGHPKKLYGDEIFLGMGHHY